MVSGFVGCICRAVESAFANGKRDIEKALKERSRHSLYPGFGVSGLRISDVWYLLFAAADFGQRTGFVCPLYWLIETYYEWFDIRYCPSGWARGSFCGLGVLCLGVFSELSPCRVRVCDLLLCVFGKERRPRILIRGNCLRFAFVLTWKKTQTTHPHTRELSAIFHCPYLKKNTDHTDAGVPPAATRRCHSLSLVTCFAAALELPKEYIWF